MQAVEQAAARWWSVPPRHWNTWDTCKRRALAGQDTRWARRALAVLMGRAAARGFDADAAGIKAMIIACS